MNRQGIIEAIRKKRSFLCAGLDTEVGKLPVHLTRNHQGILQFNRDIIEKVSPYAVSYKINTAFYEQYGSAGWAVMEETLGMLPTDCFRIADAKRGDIGNTSTMYARAFFDTMNFDAVTVAPYMGEDSLRPFLEFPDKWIICLALTSNSGHADFQRLATDRGLVYERVIEMVSKWGNPGNLMFVVGATRSRDLAAIRKQIPEHFLLVPGVGAQGGSVADVCSAGLNSDVGLLINASRSILYASDGEDFADAAASEAAKLQAEMSPYIL